MGEIEVDEILLTRADVVPNTFDEEQRTVEVVFATENPIVRDIGGWYDVELIDEVLACTPKNVRAERFQNGLPLLDNHSRWEGTRGVYGNCKNLRFENNTCVATVRFSRKAAAEEAFQDVKDGILTTVSVGYRVWEYSVAKKEGQRDSYRAVDWEPMEISLAPIPADYKATIRSVDGKTRIFNLKQADESGTEKKRAMGEDEKNIETPQTPTPTPPVAEVRTENGASAERTRVQAIRAAVRAANLDEALIDNYVDKGTAIDAVRADILERLAANQPQISNHAPNASVRGDEGEDFRRNTIAGLMVRTGDSALITAEDRTRAGSRRGGFRMRDIATDCLVRAGVDTRGMNDMELFARAITQSTSDFPVLLEGTINRVLLTQYQAAPDTWSLFCKTGQVSDFRKTERIRPGTFSRLDEINENGEYKNKPIPDGSKESIRAKPFGNLINVSRRMLVDDDLGAFVDLATYLARAAKRSIEIDVYDLFALNSGGGPTMNDGNPLFHSSHLNIGTGSALSVSGIDADLVLMASQKDPNGNDYLDLMPSVLLVPIGLRSTALNINQAEFDVSVSNKFQVPNVVRGVFRTVVGTPRLSGTTRYLLADPGTEPVFEVVFLDGIQEPYIEQNQPFHVDGMQWKVRLDYGVGAIGFKGAVKNAGA